MSEDGRSSVGLEGNDYIPSERPTGASPTRISNPQLQQEARRALVWTGVIGLVILCVWISESLLVIFGAFVFAAMVDGGARLLGRIAPVSRTIRVGVVLLLTSAFFVWLFWYGGTQVSREAAQFPELLNRQVLDLIAYLQSRGFEIGTDAVQGIASQLASGVGTVTRVIGGLFGGLTTMLLILIIGIYMALEPDLYERGFAWLIPSVRRDDFYITASRMAATMRRLMAGRLLGMLVEGIFTWALLAWYGVPMAALLGILTGLLAFVPNVGAIVSGVLMVIVGFSGGVDMGLFTIFVYLLVQTIDGYILVPMIARKTVDLAPGLVLSMQLVMGVLFGLLGLFLADPLLAMIKVALERRAEINSRDDEMNGKVASPALTAPAAANAHRPEGE